MFLLRNNDEKKRQKLINKLIFLNVYHKDDQKLYELPLSKLEYEYRRFRIQNHPHGEFGSIQWI
ncbi:Fur-regulated basic protein FbpA [Neobacillus drentensis]|uniref:Fur-regulated basic protein FbpA n=1 Tax=Neobacillus drentensis TaxID=220684 RepID=UPI002FFFBEB4